MVQILASADTGEGTQATAPGAAAAEPINTPKAPAVAAPVSPGLQRSRPRRISIRSVWIDAAIDEVGLTSNGTIETPSYARANNAAWYSGSSAPGEAGTSVIVGHVDSEKDRAVFFELRRLKPGARIDITRADGSKAAFSVDAVEQVSKNDFPTARVYAATPAPSLRLITCGGKFDQKTRRYLDNIIVYASLMA